MKFDLSAEVQVGKPPPSGGKPAARRTDQHVCPIHGGGPVAQPRTTNVLVEGMPPAGIGDTHICGASQDVLTEGVPHVHWPDAIPASAVGHKTAHGGVQSAGASHVMLVPQGGGWGKELFARLGGAVKLTGAIFTEVEATGLILVPEPTTLTKIAGGVLVVKGGIDAKAALEQILKGEEVETDIDKAVDKMTAGASPQLRGAIKLVVDIGLGGAGGLAKAADKSAISAAEKLAVWNLRATKRGSQIEKQLSQTEYKDWFHAGAQHGGTFPLIDFQKGRTLVSLKTVDTNGVTWLERMEDHIEDLGTRGATVGGQLATMVLDLRVQPGGAQAAQQLIQFGKQFGVKVIVKEYP